MAAPESASAATRDAGVTAIIIQQITFRSIGTVIAQALRRDASLRTILRQLPSLVTTTAQSASVESLAPAVDEFPPYQLQPLIKVHFGPLAMSPPLHAK